MQTDPTLPEYQSPTAFDQSDEVRAHLLEAGEIVRNWAHAQRATWTDRPLAVETWLVTPSAPPITWDQPPEGGRESVPDRPADTAPLSKKAVKIAVPESIIRWSRRLAVAAAVIATLGGAGWMTRDRWAEWSAFVKNMAGSVVPASSRAKAPAASQRANQAPATPAAPVGRLEVRSNPEAARVLVDKEFRGIAPLTIEDLPVGSYTVVLESGEGSVERRVQVTAGGIALVDEAIFSGWLNVFSPIELEISEGTRAILLNDQSGVLMPPGTHNLIFANRQLGYSTARRVQIKPGETTAISIVPDQSTVTVIATLPAEVFIDGERAGDTPLRDQAVSLGTREITVRSLTGIERRFTITVGAQPARLDVDFSAP